MVEQILRGDTLPAGVIDEVVRKTDGVPLFIEELTKSVLESAQQAESEPAWGPRPIEIPSTLRDSLAARLDRLGPAKAVAQLAAVIGREFSHELLSAVSECSAAALDKALDQLMSAELIYRSQESRGSNFTFKHALIHDTAYQTLLKSTRKARHGRVALTLEDRFPERIASQPGVMARHCEEGGLLEKAVLYYERAGEQSANRTANTEAIGHFTRGIELLHRLPETGARDEHELGLQVLLGSLLEAATGWGSEAAAAIHARTRVLCERTGDTPALFPALRGLVTFYTARADLTSAFELSNKLLRLAEQGQQGSQLLIAHHQLANVLYFRGDPSAAIEHYGRAIALYDPKEQESLKSVYGSDLGTFCRSWMAWALWLVGRPDQAVRTCEEAIALAEQASHPFSLAFAQLWAAGVHIMRREPDRAREFAKRAIAISEEEGFALVLGGGRVVSALADLQPGLGEREVTAVMERARSGLAAVAATGNATGVPGNLSFFADRYRAVGRLDDAFQTVEAALAVAEKTEQSNWNAELYRIKAELMLDTNAGETPAQRLLEDALALAHRQQAKSIELRVAMTLARLWKRRGEREAARDLLANVYERFEEGHDTPDLMAAAALLDELA
jgi:tetratricopeptide (TPR) repeat protein